MSESWKTMLGTEGTGKYVVIARNLRGDRLGLRPLGNGFCRIRVEPADQTSVENLQDTLSFSKGWKQPGQDGQQRFSIVVRNSKGEPLVGEALTALKRVGDGHLERNRDQLAWQWRRLLTA